MVSLSLPLEVNLLSDKREPLSHYSEEKLKQAMKKYKTIEPFLIEQITLKNLSIENGIPLRTLQS